MNMSVKVENKKTKIAFTRGEQEATIDYRNLLNGVIGRQAVDSAWTISELKDRLAIIEIIENGEELEFTEAQFESVKAEVLKTKWTIAHVDIVNFVEYISELK